MSVRAQFAHRFRMLRFLRASLVLGALYDLAFAAMMVVAPGPVAGLLGLPLPGAPFYLWLLATLLAMLAALYLIAARHPRRYDAVIVVAIAGRWIGALAFAVAALRGSGLGALYLLAAADAAFGSAHAVGLKGLAS